MKTKIFYIFIFFFLTICLFAAKDVSATYVNCPVNSSYDTLKGSCMCNSGYTADNSGYQGQCVSLDSICKSQLGPYAYYDTFGSKTCKCSGGEIIGSSGQCESVLSVCNSRLGYNSTYDSISKTCKCNSGYLIDTSGQCISQSSYCSNQLGSMSKYNSLTNKCECVSGYVYDGSKCAYKSTSNSNTPPTLTPDQACQKNYGAYAKYSGSLNVSGGYVCTCVSGYEMKNNTCQKVVPPVQQCQTGYEMNGGVCVQPNQECQKDFGVYSEIVNPSGSNYTSAWVLSQRSSYLCTCQIGYKWNSDKTLCIVSQVVSAPAAIIAPAAVAPQEIIPPQPEPVIKEIPKIKMISKPTPKPATNTTEQKLNSSTVSDTSQISTSSVSITSSKNIVLKDVLQVKKDNWIVRLFRWFGWID